MHWPTKIKQYIIANRVSTTEVADALGKEPLYNPEIKCLVPGSRAVGFVHYAMAAWGSNYHLHAHIEDAPPGSVVLADALQCQDQALFGHLVAKYLLLYRQCAGIVACGLVRDAHAILKEKYPVWGYGFSPRGCFNNETDLNPDVFKAKQDYYEGALIVADDCGVVLIPRGELDGDLFEQLTFIEDQEDRWFRELDYHKKSTFQIVCNKRGVSNGKPRSCA